MIPLPPEAAQTMPLPPAPEGSGTGGGDAPYLQQPSPAPPETYAPPLSFGGWLMDNKLYVLGGVAVLAGVYWVLNRPAPRRASVAGLGRLPHHKAKSKRRVIARRVKG